VKLALYAQILSYQVPSQFLPLGGQPGKLDSFTALDTNPIITSLAYNTGTGSNIVSENSGGNASFFPWGAVMPNVAGGAVGSCIMSFHQDLASIPPSERVNAICLRSSDLQATESSNPGVNIALAAMMWAPYPCGIFRFNVNTLDTAGGNGAAQSFVPLANLIEVPGLTRLRFLLPVVNNSAPPADQGAANNNLSMRPRTGPSASNTLTANTELNVSFAAAGGLTEYNLAEFIYTWMAGMATIDMTTIQKFMEQMDQTTGRSDDRRAALEFAMALSTDYNRLTVTQYDATHPNLAVSGNQTGLLHAVNTVVGFNVVNIAHIFDISRVGGAYPKASVSNWQWMLPGCSPAWFSAIAAGAVVSAAIGNPSLTEGGDLVGLPQLLQYSRYVARAYAAGYQTFFMSTGLPVSVWNSLFVQTNFTGIRNFYRDLWINPNSKGYDPKHLVAPLGDHIASITAVVTGFKCQRDGWGNTLHSYLNTPQANFATGVTTGFNPILSMIPVVLPDVWYYATCDVIAKGVQSWPAPVNKARGLINTSEKVAVFAGGSRSVTIDPMRQSLNIGTREFPLLSDTETYNSRLIRHVRIGIIADLYTTDGTVFATQNVPPGYILTQRQITPDATMPNYVFGRLGTACTTWIPKIDALGHNLVVATTAANGGDYMTQILAGHAFANLEAWEMPDKTIEPNTIIGGMTQPGPKMKKRTLQKDESLNLSASSNNEESKEAQ